MKINQKLSALVMAGLLTGIAGRGWAAVPEAVIWGEYQDYQFPSATLDPLDGFVTLRVWEPGTEVTYPRDEGSNYVVTRSLLGEGSSLVASNAAVKSELASMALSFTYLQDLLGGPVKGVPVISVCLHDDRDGGASALSWGTEEFADFGTDLGQYFLNDEETALTTSDFYAGLININLAKDYTSDYYGLNVLCANGIFRGHTSVLLHEMIHALGLSTDCYASDGVDTVLGNNVYPARKIDYSQIFNLGLHDAYGKSALAADEGREWDIKVIAKADFDPEEVPLGTAETFCMVEGESYCGVYYMTTDEDGNVDTNSEVYKVLDGAEIAWPDDYALPAVPGLPVNGFEIELNDEEGNTYWTPELSHIELQNSFLSHQEYRNWGVLMEAEIALLQDMGYNIDRSKFYGGSLYDSDVEGTVLEEDFTSSQQYAIGYHVYGSNNTVDFGAAIEPTGSGAVGIRVDGIGNDIEVNRVVNVCGNNATGVLFSYGKNHNLTVSAPVTASGAGGIGLRFDFGDNMLGDGKEYRGSYIWGYYDTVLGSTFGFWKDKSVANAGAEGLTALAGPLMTRVDVNADITGKEQAIYIAKNAYVQELNINTENINGNITSEWNPTGSIFTAAEMGSIFGESYDLHLNSCYEAAAHPENLMTALNFNKDTVVRGTISGYDSLDMTVGKRVVVAGNVLVHKLAGANGDLYVGGGLLAYQDAGEFSGNITVAEGDLLGAYRGSMKEGEWLVYNEQPNQANTQLSQMNSSLLLGWRAQNNDLNKRMGELRFKNGEAGIWARMNRGENEAGATKRLFNLYQVGYDHEIGDNWIGGVALSWNKGQSHTYGATGYAKGEDETGSLGLYASRLNKDGTFVDLIAKYGRSSNDVDSCFATGMGSFDYHTPAMSVSAEVGRRYQKGKWWLEPQAEFTYGFDRGAEYRTSNGLHVQQEAFKTATGRLGMAAGVDLSCGNIYVRASYLYDFEGDSAMQVQWRGQIRNYHEDLGGGWWEVGIGTNWKTGKDSYIYGDVEKTYGGSMHTPWRWNLGVRWSF